jgi:hypothetical protein
LPHLVTISTPAEGAAVDPSTGNRKTLPPTLVANVPARIQQRVISHIGLQIELTAEQNTVVSVWSIYVGRDTVLTPASTVTDAQGRTFAIQGNVAERPDHRPQFRVAAARLISDMQN